MKSEKFNIYELIGVIIGDGYIKYMPKHGVYTLEITGNAYHEVDYYEKIKNFLSFHTKKTPKVYVKNETKGKSLKLILNSKEYVELLINRYKIPYQNKGSTVKIDDKFIPWRYSRHIVRGIFETDGSLFFSKISGIRKYPRLEIKTASDRLAYQIIEILSNKGFRVNIISPKKDKCYRIYLSGPKMLEKWVNEIGFSTINNISKYLFLKKVGVYVPKMPFEERVARVAQRLLRSIKLK